MSWQRCFYRGGSGQAQVSCGGAQGFPSNVLLLTVVTVTGKEGLWDYDVGKCLFITHTGKGTKLNWHSVFLPSVLLSVLRTIYLFLLWWAQTQDGTGQVLPH